MTATLKIRGLRARPVLVPFKRPPASASGAIPTAALVLIDLFPEFSVHLLGVTPTCHWLEFMDWAEPVIQEPIRVVDGLARIPDRPGAGLAWNEDAVNRYSA